MLMLISNSYIYSEENVTELPEVRVYEIFGMDCPACHGGLEKVVEKIPAVEDARANWVKQTLHVTIRPGQTLEDDAVRDAIERANFTAGKSVQ